MSTKSPPSNNERLRELIQQHGLTQARALELFNEGLVKPYKQSTWKAFLSSPEAVRYRKFDDRLLAHAEKVFAKLTER